MKIAVIGSGISGLGSGLILSKCHEVHVFEAGSRLGGHAHTVSVPTTDGLIPMDTGFLVFNELTYPHLTAFFKYLSVETINSDMSLSIGLDHKGMEWSGTNLNSVFGQRKNLWNLGFHFMLLEVLRFHREAESNLALARRHAWTLKELLDARKFSATFRTDYLLPMSAAIWSTPPQAMLDFPAATFLTFMLNHKLVQVNNRPQWKTVRQGSVQYVQKVASQLSHIHLQTEVCEVERLNTGKVRLRTKTDEVDFDRVVFATHAPVTARILKDKTSDEQRVLGSFQVEANRALLHQDVSAMPREKRCWASWNVKGSKAGAQKQISLSYHLNRLQELKTQQPFVLTLNPDRPLESVRGTYHYDHPRFDQTAIRAQRELPQLQGHSGVYFAGAWTRYGFHEDGLLSAVNVAKEMGVETPWSLK